jgi:DNA polymerase III sliding clamp (beta) subunit (PCNA family)
VLSFGEDVGRVHGSGQDATAADEVTCAYTGEAKELTLSVRYALAALAVAGGAEVDLHFGTYRQPFLLTPVGAAFPYRQFIAPMRPAR